MAVVLGADWGRGVYAVARVDLDRMDLTMSVAESAEALLSIPCDLLAVDMPIGLSENGARACDAAARKCVPGRTSSVFNVPIRPILNAETRAEASAQSREIAGLGVGAQTFAFTRHIREMDEALQSADLMSRERTWEIHPEVSFAALSEGATLAHSKRSDQGAALRREALGTWLWPSRIASALDALPSKLAARDDILDSIVAAWSAARILRNEHRTVTDGIPRDSTGLRMTVAY